MSSTRYGFYLRPSFAMCRAQTEIHDLLSRQYGLQAAGKFMPHGTIKGFFRSDVSPAEMVARLDPVLAGFEPFPVYNGGMTAYHNLAIVLDIHHTPDGERNERLQALHEAASAALLPLVHPECEFTPWEPSGEQFTAHLTLAMADIPARFFDEIFRFVREADPIGPSSFLLKVVQLFAFTSEAWDGPWWETLRWNLLHSWRLSPSPA
jgi:2'-5' RNA ligase